MYSPLGDIESRRDREGLSVVHGLDGGKLEDIALNELSESHQELTTSMSGHDLTPRGSVGGLSNLDGNVNVDSGGLGDRGDDLSGGRVDGVDGLALLSGNVPEEGRQGASQ